MGLHQVHGDPGEHVDPQAQAEGAVGHHGLQRRAQARRGSLAVLLALAGAGENQEEGRGAGQAEQQPGQQHPPRVFGPEGADDQQRHGEGQQAGEYREEHAVRGQGGPLVVVVAELRGERQVGHGHEGGGRVEHQVGQRVVGGQGQRRLQRRPPPQQGEGQPERQSPEQQERPAPAPAAARPVGEVADHGVVHVVPGASDEQGGGGQARGQAHHVGQEDGQVGADQGGGQAEAGIAGAVGQLGFPGQAVLHAPMKYRGGHGAGTIVCAARKKI